MTTNQEYLTRVKKGNEVFNQVWRQARIVASDSTAWNEQMNRIDRAYPKLDVLCLQLMADGYDKCLYAGEDRENRCFDGFICWVCPKPIEANQSCDTKRVVEPLEC